VDFFQAAAYICRGSIDKIHLLDLLDEVQIKELLNIVINLSNQWLKHGFISMLQDLLSGNKKCRT
jgi:hypothetical protein